MLTMSSSQHAFLAYSVGYISVKHIICFLRNSFLYGIDYYTGAVIRNSWPNRPVNQGFTFHIFRLFPANKATVRRKYLKFSWQSASFVLF